MFRYCSYCKSRAVIKAIGADRQSCAAQECIRKFQSAAPPEQILPKPPRLGTLHLTASLNVSEKPYFISIEPLVDSNAKQFKVTKHMPLAELAFNAARAFNMNPAEARLVYKTNPWFDELTYRELEQHQTTVGDLDPILNYTTIAVTTPKNPRNLLIYYAPAERTVTIPVDDATAVGNIIDIAAEMFNVDPDKFGLRWHDAHDNWNLLDEHQTMGEISFRSNRVFFLVDYPRVRLGGTDKSAKFCWE